MLIAFTFAAVSLAHCEPCPCTSDEGTGLLCSPPTTENTGNSDCTTTGHKIGGTSTGIKKQTERRKGKTQQRWRNAVARQPAYHGHFGVTGNIVAWKICCRDNFFTLF